jgi:branched-chain amino acid transport system ATP-binding protein
MRSPNEEPRQSASSSHASAASEVFPGAEKVGRSTSEHHSEASLRAESVSVRYGGVIANQDVSLAIAPGQIVGLIGPNGAGKTTFIDALTGYAPYSGAVRVGGQRLDGLAPHRRQHAGLARTWQAGELFRSLSVADNVRVSTDWGQQPRPTWRHPRISRDLQHVESSLDMVGLSAFGTRHTSELSLGQQRLVGVARALASAPKVLLLDEPAAGLDPAEGRELGRSLKEVAASGIAMLFVDHDVSLVFEVSDIVYVLDFGKVIAVGTPDEIRSNDAVVKAYLGAPGSLEEAE